jgi:RNA polymerase sigma-70 factor, ECF subfamily
MDSATVCGDRGNRRGGAFSVTERREPPQSRAMEPFRAPAVPTDGALPAIDFTELFERHFDYVWFTLRRLGVLERDLEDVTHDVFVQVYKQLDEFDDARPVRPWLFGFSYRLASDYRRLARHRFEMLGDDVDPLDGSPSAAEHLMTRQKLELVWEALAELDLERRAVFILHQVEGCPTTEVAKVLQIPLNTAYSRLRLAREQFAKAAQRLRAQRGEP